MQLFIIRGLVAIAWATVLAVLADSPTTGVTVGAGILVVLYPLIDVVASLVDARSQRGPARQLLLAGAASSAVAAIALAVAATGSVANVLAVFGVWAAVSGAAQLVVALRRRAQFGKQWPMRLAGAGSVLFGFAFLIVWEWFERESGDIFRKLQGSGRVKVRFASVGDMQQIAEIHFLDDVTMRLDRFWLIPFTGRASDHVVVRKGSVLWLSD